MLAGQIQEVCVLAGGELSTTRTASVVLDVDLPISGEFGILYHYVHSFLNLLFISYTHTLALT